jgi:hypothetical protein
MWNEESVHYHLSSVWLFLRSLGVGTTPTWSLGKGSQRTVSLLRIRDKSWGVASKYLSSKALRASSPPRGVGWCLWRGRRKAGRGTVIPAGWEQWNGAALLKANILKNLLWFSSAGSMELRRPELNSRQTAFWIFPAVISFNCRW